MNAVVQGRMPVTVPRSARLHREILWDADLSVDGKAHMEATEVPQWIAECGDHDLTGAVTEALSELEDKPREQFNKLLAEVCTLGELMPAQRMLEVVTQLQAALTAYSVAQAQRFVEREGV